MKTGREHPGKRAGKDPIPAGADPIKEEENPTRPLLTAAKNRLPEKNSRLLRKEMPLPVRRARLPNPISRPARKIVPGKTAARIFAEKIAGRIPGRIGKTGKGKKQPEGMLFRKKLPAHMSRIGEPRLILRTCFLLCGISRWISRCPDVLSPGEAETREENKNRSKPGLGRTLGKRKLEAA